ncbi:MAG TPA: imidazole glycerol phosphate synthase subunit HisH [Steroidobacteraceae bacterium]|jgi:glutamine amidotransferase|nr:imidazole glycerol phosphate synthase subunit HisH [Steroidobacteraceae bacterium]
MINPGAGRIVGLIDYQAGNVQSLDNALSHLGARVRRVVRADEVEGCTHLLLPGVGAFGFCAERLRTSGLLDTIRQWAMLSQRPLLGICVGMQLLADGSEESPGVAGLGWIGGTLSRIPAGPGIRVPHVGWNSVEFLQPHGDFAAGATADFYFDHSFAWPQPQGAEVVGACTHGAQFRAIVRRENVVAAQFHPEKSQAAGLRFLEGFLRQ